MAKPVEPETVHLILYRLRPRLSAEEKPAERVAKVEQAKQELRQLLLAGVPAASDQASLQPYNSHAQKLTRYKDKGFNAARQEFIDYINKITE